MVVGLVEDGLSGLYTDVYLPSPAQVADLQDKFFRRVDERCPGVLYLKALQYDLTSMQAEGAFLVEYNIKDPFGGIANSLSVTRFYKTFQINNDNGELNTNSLLKYGPPGRHANVDPSWTPRYGISRLTELSYTVCDTNLTGGLAGAVDAKKHVTTGLGSSKKVRKPAAQESSLSFAGTRAAACVGSIEETIGAIL